MGVAIGLLLVTVVLSSSATGQRTQKASPLEVWLLSQQHEAQSELQETSVFATGERTSGAAEGIASSLQVATSTATVTASVPPATATATAVPPTATPSPTPTLAPINPPAWGGSPNWNGVPAPPISATAAIVIDEASGEVLYDQRGHERFAQASLTKIMTAVVALKKGDLDQWIDIDVDSRLMNGSSLMGLLPGDRFNLNHLLYGLMLPSGNDAAIAIGRGLSGSEPAFVEEMNAMAKELGLHNSHFANTHGLDADGHYQSAYDLAMLSRYALSMPEFWPYSSTKYINVWGSRQMLLKNLNPILYLYPGGDGVKTGFTGDAGKTLVASVTQNGHRVFVVLLNSPEREGDAVKLFDWAFANHSWND